MKKDLMFVALLSAGVALNSAVAQSIRPLDTDVKLERTVPEAQSKMTAKDFMHITLPQEKARQMHLSNPVKLNGFNFFKAPNRVAAEDLSAYYIEPVGALHFGVNLTTGGLFIPSLFLPAFKDVQFINASVGDFVSWSMGDYTMDEAVGADNNSVDGDGNLTLKFPTIGGTTSMLPTITVAADDNSTASYYYAQDAEFDGRPVGASAIFFGMPVDSLSMCDYLAEGGFFMAMDDENYYGSMTRDGVKCTSVMSLIRPAAPLYIESMYIMAVGSYNDEGVVTRNPIPDGGTLTLTLYKVTEEGTITDEVIATSTATLTGDAQSTITPLTAFGDGFYAVHFDFYDIADDGFKEKVALTIDEPFVAAISGFDQEGFDVRFPFTVDNSGMMGSGYMTFGDELSFFSLNDILGDQGFEGGDQFNATHLMLQMNAAYTCFDFYLGEQGDVVVPVEGGMGVTAVVDGTTYYDIDIASSYPVEDPVTGESYVWFNSEEMPDWLTLSVDDSMYDQMSVLLFYVEGEPLPAGVEGRSADITIYTLGNQATFRVVQGDVTSISTVENAQLNVINNGDSFALSYAEGIRGVQVVNVAGQVVADYALDGTSATIPAAALAKGLYILKFDNGQSVKVMK